MKKISMIVLLILVLLLCLSSCNGLNSSTMDAVYQTLNQLVQQSYTSVELTVITTVDDMELTAKYQTTDDTISYVIEEMRLISPDDAEGLGADYKKTVTGTVSVENGEFSQSSDMPIQLPAHDTLIGGVSFQKSYFTDVTVEEGTFFAKVTDPSGFLQTELAVTNMTVHVFYAREKLDRMELAYSKKNAEITLLYTFE